jgi:hypothetical protein
MRILLIAILATGCASKKAEPKAPAAAAPVERKDSKDATTDKDASPDAAPPKRKSDPCEGGQ